jgi:DNA-binding NarL/FixJ family response regulator
MKISTLTLDDLDKKILHGIRHGLRFKEVANQIGITEARARKRMFAMRKYYCCDNNTQLIIQLREAGLIE